VTAGHTPALTGSIDDPDFRHRRAVHAAKSRTTVDHHIDAIVASAPSLTAEQADRLSSLLSERGGPDAT